MSENLAHGLAGINAQGRAAMGQMVRIASNMIQKR
jgi:hypothetical protein